MKNCWRWGFLLLFISSFSLTFVCAGEDFYKLLAVGKDANDREIRKAFKKLALIYHPDKNKDDPKAHDHFVKINRAYEVLKDEEMRKKYDLHGEEGIKDGSGQNYQSWTFYKNQFGIYDEDPEIITLSRSDFDQSVSNSDDFWFVNFYSVHCSHCHELAPTWRKIARELDGVVRIGAVNCQEDFFLCQELGIFNYPSLLLFPQKETYSGPRSVDDLINFVMKKVPKSQFVTLKTQKDLESTGDSEIRPWLIDICTNEDCLSTLTRKKLAVMLDGLVTVGNINCRGNSDLCDRLKLDSGVYFFPDGVVQTDKAEHLNSLDARELAFSVLELLPDMVELSQVDFETLISQIESGEQQAWLIQFVGSEVEKNLELRKLPALLREIKVGRVSCTQHPSVCSTLFVHKFPTFALFKSTGGFEIHHGRLTAHDLALFARDSAATNVRVLGPADFPTVSTGGQMWFVDFFTPWCPPCMKLLPEFRKAAKILGDSINFGTVDCTNHGGLCQQLGVHSYPTSILYNNSEPNNFVGLHSVDELLNFVEDIKNPPVLTLSSATFQSEVTLRESSEIYIVDFFAPWCGPCMELAPEFRKLAKMFGQQPFIHFGSVDCTKNVQLCQASGIQGYPTIRIYPLGNQHPQEYRNWFRDAFNLRQWILGFLPTKVKTLDHAEFVKEVLDATEPWLVDFYAPWCGHCQIFAPEYERIAGVMEGKVKLGKIDCDSHPQVCQSANVRAYPTVRFYGGKLGHSAQNSNGVDINSQNGDVIMDFVYGKLKEKEKKLKNKTEL